MSTANAPHPVPVDVSISQAAAAYPHLCAYVARELRDNHIPAEELLTALDAADSNAGNKLSGFEQNFDGGLPFNLDNLWRVLCAYSDVLTGDVERGKRGADGVYPWMADRCGEILAGMGVPEPAILSDGPDLHRETQAGRDLTIINLHEIDDENEALDSIRTPVRREAAVSLLDDAIVIDLALPNSHAGAEDIVRRVYIEARPDGWKVYLHSDDGGDCDIVTLADDGHRHFEAGVQPEPEETAGRQP